MKINRILVALILVGSLCSAYLAINKYYLEKDYFVYANVSCQPTESSCFIGDGENTPLFYKSIAKKAYRIPACDGWKNECPELACETEDEDCTITYCDHELDEGSCYGPILR